MRVAEIYSVNVPLDHPDRAGNQPASTSGTVVVGSDNAPTINSGE